MTIALVGFAAVLVLAFLRLPLGFVALITGLVGFAAMRGWNWSAALAMTGQQIMETGASYGLSVIPLFILMGVFIHRSGISEDLFAAAYALTGRYRGGLGHASVVACAGFSAVSGSSLATSATMTRIALPHMRKWGYNDGLSTGVLAAGGTLGIMIPPSVPLVIYGLVAQQDIGRLFIAGILPGLLLVVLFLCAVAVTCWLRPDLGPRGATMPASERFRAYLRVWPVILLFAAVLGGIYLGAFTPTEAAGLGAFGAAAFALWRGGLRSVKQLSDTLVETLRITSALFTVVFGTMVFANFINLTGLPYDLMDIIAAAELSPMGVVLAICFLCIFLGMVFESIGLLLLIIPVFLPTLILLDIDLIWFGIVTVIVIELALITPPIGLNVFVVKAVARDVPLSAIFCGVLPFVVADLLALAILFAWAFW